MMYDYFRVPASRCARSFSANTDLSLETFSSLKAAAHCNPCVQCKSSTQYRSKCTLEKCVTPVRKASALRCLRKYFLAQLEADPSWETAFNKDVYSHLTDEIARTESEGVKRACQVCCQSNVLLRCTLRANGKVNVPTSPILPGLPSDWSIGAQANLQTRRQMYSDALARWQGDDVDNLPDACSNTYALHGSILFYLPSDFLCLRCQSDFMALGIIVQSGVDDMLGRCREHASEYAKMVD